MNSKALGRLNILGVRISTIDMEDACLTIESAIIGRLKEYVCVCPVSTIMACKNDERVLRSVNSANLVTPDGMAVVWLGWMQGFKNIRRVYGPELMQNICEISAKKGYRHYFYGSTEDILNKLEEKLSGEYPGLIISGKFSPPFRQLTVREDKEIIERINKDNPDIVWVGLGSPKQDVWMHEHRDKLNASVLIGVGAAFDFLSGTKPQAPRWIGDHGFEWLFRLVTEPKRLWHRYLISYPLFVYFLIIDSVKRLTNSCKS